MMKAGSATSMFETIRNFASRRPSRSNSGKYFWFVRIVRIRHSCGTCRNSLSNCPTYTAGHSTSAQTSSSSAPTAGSVPSDAPSALALASSIASMRARRASKSGITRPFCSSRRTYSCGSETDSTPAPWKRCPKVVRPDSSPSSVAGTTSSPCSTISRCAGRTKLTLVAPSASWYSMTLGIGSFAIASASTASITPASASPCAVERK